MSQEFVHLYHLESRLGSTSYIIADDETVLGVHLHGLYSQMDGRTILGSYMEGDEDIEERLRNPAFPVESGKTMMISPPEERGPVLICTVMKVELIPRSQYERAIERYETSVRKTQKTAEIKIESLEEELRIVTEKLDRAREERELATSRASEALRYELERNLRLVT